MLRKHPVVLARFTATYVESELRASKDGLARVRSGLGDVVPVFVVEDAVAAWQEQTARLTRVRRAVALIEEAMRGKIFLRCL